MFFKLSSKPKTGRLSPQGASFNVGYIAHGIPQDSIIGPILFTNIIHVLFLGGRQLLFADETTLLNRGSDMEQLQAEADNPGQGLVCPK